MSNFVSGPTTYDQLRWSANAFRSLSNDATCIAARAPEFRQPLLQGRDDADWAATGSLCERVGLSHPPE